MNLSYITNLALILLFCLIWVYESLTPNFIHILSAFNINKLINSAWLWKAFLLWANKFKSPISSTKWSSLSVKVGTTHKPVLRLSIDPHFPKHKLSSLYKMINPMSLSLSINFQIWSYLQNHHGAIWSIPNSSLVNTQNNLPNCGGLFLMILLFTTKKTNQNISFNIFQSLQIKKVAILMNISFHQLQINNHSWS